MLSLVLFAGCASTLQTGVSKSAGYYPGECRDLSSFPPKEKELVAFVCKAKAFTFAKDHR